MKKILIDINIILDFLNKRNFHQQAAKIIDLCAEKKVHGYVCAHEITTISYFLLKEQKDKAKARNTISFLLEVFTIIPLEANILKESLVSPITDYEDAVIEVSALIYNIDTIISRNLSDFKNSRIQAVTPEEFLSFE